MTPGTLIRPGSAVTPQAPAPALPLWKRLLFTAVMLAVCLGTLELSARWYLRHFQGYDGRHLLQYEFDPYKNLLPTRNFVDTRGIQHNSQGFRRSSEVSRAKSAGTYRIFLMGGSTAYGTGGLWPHLQRDYAVLTNEETIDAFLERSLREAVPGVRFEVVNAGIPSAWTHHELIYLNQTILGYDPDMVVFLDGFNDFFITREAHDQFSDYAYKEHSHVIMGPPTLPALASANLWWLTRRSAFAHVSVRQLRSAKDLVGSIASPRRMPMDVEDNLERLQRVFPRGALAMVRRSTALLRDEGVRSVFVLQPMLVLERERRGMPEIERRLFQFNVESYLPNYEQFILRAVPIVRDLTRASVEGNEGQFVDGTTAFDRRETRQIFTDYAHLTPTGNSLLAETIARAILPTIEQDLAGSAAEGAGGGGAMAATNLTDHR
jgi:hypothetical protein